MNRLEDILKRLEDRHGIERNVTAEELAERRCKAVNNDTGNLNELDGYDCPICKNKGVTYFMKATEFGYKCMTQAECECMKIRRTLKRAKASGLNNILSDYTFAKYEVTDDWQREIKEKAQAFCKDEGAHWFYIGGQSGCVDSETEFFDGVKWKSIAKYATGDKVLIYNPTNGRAEIDYPQRYINKPAEKMYQVTTTRGSINMCLSEDHDFAYRTSKGHFQKKPMRDVVRLHSENVQGFYGKVETAFNYSGKGINLSDNEIRIMCAVMADGSFRKGLKLCTVNIKKERKKERLRKLLDGMEYKEYRRADGYSVFRFYAPRREKEFTDFWYGCSNKQLAIVADEVFYWDGRKEKNRSTYYSTSKQSADFVQFAISATGNRSTICIDKREGKTICYIVNKVNGASTVSMASTGGKNKAEIIEAKTKDGRQYCFTVKTGYLILRRNNRIFVTGNCGKTHICTAIAGHYIESGKDCRYMLWRDDAVKLKQLVNDYTEYQNLIEEYKQVDVLYIDDLFKSQKGAEPTRADINIAFELLNNRLMDKSKITVISSEFPIREALQFDEATIGRVYQQAGVYKISIDKDMSKNYRLRG